MAPVLSSLDYLMPRLMGWQRSWVGILERDASLINDSEAKAEVEKLLAAARNHLQALEQMSATHAKTGAH